MKSKFTSIITGRCESHSCADVHERCNRDAKLYAVYGNGLGEAQEYYYCEKAVNIDKAAGFIVVELEPKK